MLTLSKLRKASKLIFRFAALALFAWGVVLLAQEFWLAFTQLDPTVAASLLAAVATVLVSVISVLYAKRVEQKIAIRKEHREKKIPVYEDLIAFIFRVIYAQTENGSSISDEEIVETHSLLTQKAIIWASDDVLQAFHAFRLASRHADTNKLAIAVAIEDLFLAIRRDLGHKNQDINRGQLLRLFINDLHKLVEN